MAFAIKCWSKSSYLILLLLTFANMKTAVITGATKGIGKAIAEMFLRKGFSLAICARTQSDLDFLEKQWQREFPLQKVLTRAVDMGDKDAVKSFGAAVLEHFPEGSDVLVNNAGLFFPGNLADEPEGRLEELMQVHVFGAYYLSRVFLPKMKEKKAGHIFNICSVASLHAYPNGGAYGIAKYALMGFTDNLRQELMGDNIKVTAVTPGAVWTDSWKNSGFAEERLMDVADVAKMIEATYDLSGRANVDNIVIRPQLGDL